MVLLVGLWGQHAWVWFVRVCMCLSLWSACVYMYVCLALGHEFPHLLGDPAGQLGAGLFLFVV